MELDEENNSIWLVDILNRIGVNDFRKVCHRLGITREIVMTLPNYQTNSFMYLMGSSFEGTRTPGEEMDLDFLKSAINIPVIEDIATANTQWDSLSLLLIDDLSSPAGYVKLQIVLAGVPVTNSNLPSHINIMPFKCDENGRILLIDLPEIDDPSYVRPKNKPAATLGDGEYHIDDVLSYQCSTWPTMAQEYLSRYRPYVWPSSDMIQELQLLGFFVVRKGHPFSLEADFEWRISLSLQERKLMCNLTDIQHKCYIVLKMLNREVINLENITSYHWKTCLFYVIEQNNLDIWQQQRLIHCVKLCIKQMLSWVKNELCPNYFIPKENMFDGKLNANLKSNSIVILLKLLNDEFCCMCSVKASNMCDYVQSRGSVETIQRLQENSNKVYRAAVSREYLYMTEIVVLHFNLYIIERYNEQANGNICNFIKSLWNSLDHIQYLETLTKHTAEETKHSLSVLIPHIYTCLASNIASLAIQHPNPQVRDFLLLGSFVCFMKGGLSGTLKFVSVLYALGLFEDCEWLLEELDEEFIKNDSHVCGCIRTKKVLDQYTSYDRFFETSELRVSTCISFLPMEIPITPDALQYEMFRCIGISLPENEKNSLLYRWHYRAVIDSNIYFFFLKIVIHKKFGNEMKYLNALQHYSDLVNQGKNINHRDVAWNVLIWLIGSENHSHLALYCLGRSLQMINSYELCSVVPVEEKIRKHFFSIQQSYMLL